MMNDIKQVFPEDMKTLQEYAVQLISMLFSMKSHKNYHLQAQKIGILDDAEALTSVEALMNIDKLVQVYRRQLENVLERIPESEEDLVLRINSFFKLAQNYGG
jgi:hypothetical protein